MRTACSVWLSLRARDGMVPVPMAWIPLLLAGWFVLDVLIVAILLVIARRNRQRELRAAAPIPELRPIPPPGWRGAPVRSALPTR